MTQSTAQEEELSLKLFVVLTRTLQSIKKRAEEDIKCLGLNPTEFAVLELIYHKGEQAIQKIGEKVLIDSSSNTDGADKSQKKLLMARRPNPEYRRVIFAAITEKGTALMEEMFPKHKNAMQEIFAGINMKEKENMIQQLKKLGYYAESNNIR